MCKTKKIDFSLLKATKIPGLLKNFPQCGIRFKTDGDYGVVLVHPSIANQQLVKDKVHAAKIKASKAVYVVDIPTSVIDAFKIVCVPTLTEAV